MLLNTIRSGPFSAEAMPNAATETSLERLPGSANKKKTFLQNLIAKLFLRAKLSFPQIFVSDSLVIRTDFGSAPPGK